MIDIEQVIFEHGTSSAVDNAVLYALIGTRMWTPVAQKDWINEAAALVFGIPDEARHFTAATVRALFDVKCYGGTDKYRDARTVYRAFSNRFHGAVCKQTATGLILRCEQVTATKGTTEPGTGYPVVIAKFEIFAE